MSEELAALLDLKLAWKRVKADIYELKRVFVRHPYEIKLIEQDLDKWLDSLLETVRNNGYNPAPMYICDVPKEKGLIRPGSQLSLADQVIYAACLGVCFPSIHKTSYGRKERLISLIDLPSTPTTLSGSGADSRGGKSSERKALPK